MSKVNEKDLQVFIDSVTNYFDQMISDKPDVEAPYVLNDSPVPQEYTSIIDISGDYDGHVCFTAPKVMLRHLLMAHGEMRQDEDDYQDLIGEIANIISGNARRFFGSEFVISIPEVFTTRERATCPTDGRSFAIPIKWKSYRSSLFIQIH